MFQQTTLQSLIEDRVHFRPISTGWMVGKCQLCNDYKERAGFKFEGGEVVYNCWNCSKGGRYEEFSGKMSGNFRRILAAYGFEDSEVSSVVNSAFFKKPDAEEKTITLAKLTKVNTSTPTIKLPANSFPLGHPEHIEYQQKLVNYLVQRRIDLNKYPFFFSMDDRFKNRIIIPFYRHGNLIYWQARSIDPSEKKRYDNAPVGRDAVMFNIDKLNGFDRTPLFITEGVFDAMVIDGVSILGSKLNDSKTELLKKSQRRLVFVIDKDKNGEHLAKDILDKGWEIAFAPSGAEDLNQSVQRFGLIWTLRELMKSIPNSTDAALLSVNINCR